MVDSLLLLFGQRLIRLDGKLFENTIAFLDDGTHTPTTADRSHR